METNWNKLLLRQIKRQFGSLENLPDTLREFILTVNGTYENYEDDSRLLQNSIEISSQELRDAFLKQKLDTEAQKETIRKIKEAIRALNSHEKIASQDPDEQEADSGYLIDSLIRLIEERHQAKEALENERTLFRTIIDLIPDGIYVKDTEGRKLLANPKEVFFSGKDNEDEIVGRTDRELLSESDAIRSEQEDGQVTGLGKVLLNIEGNLIDKNGNYHWVLCSKVPLRDIRGKITGIVGITREITKQKETEATLLIAKQEADIANKAKSEFLANMSHEIRTPLNGVIGFTDLLMKTPLTPIQMQYAENANTSGHALLGIINDILDFSKIEAGRLDLEKIKTDIREIAEQTADIIKYQASKKGLELLLDIQHNIPQWAQTDPVRLKQILVNLVSNAVKFTTQGEVELKVTFTRIDEQLGRFSFVVRDTGIGINDELKKQLFKAFTQADSSTTRKYGGTGLGLTISSMLAEKMGGKIEIASEIGRGSSFFFSIETGYEERENPDFEIDHFIRRVLIVDDNAGSRRILESHFTTWGIEFMSLDSGWSAIDLLRRMPDFDLLVIDYQMPGFNGIDTIRMMQDELKISSEKMAIVLMSNTSDNAHIQESGENLGIRFTLGKPVKFQELLCGLRYIQIQPKEAKAEVKKTADRVVPNFDINLAPTVLIAEDVALNRLLATTLIKKLIPNTTVLEAKSGKEAYEMAITLFPDLILMDLQMPEVGGIEATILIRKHEELKDRRVPIVALTAGAIKGEKERCMEAGMDDFLTKPIDWNALIGVLKRYLN
jgi:PAS domain S-box-containing protein